MRFSVVTRLEVRHSFTMLAKSLFNEPTESKVKEKKLN